MRSVISFGLLVAGAVAQERAPKPSSNPAAVDRAAFEAVCGACHKINLVEGLRSESEWMDVLERMVNIGAKGSNEQFDAVVRVLLRDFTKVNINTASAEEIAPVLDISEPIAASIVSRRTAKGKYQTIADLKGIPGLDISKVEKRKNRIVF